MEADRIVGTVTGPTYRRHFSRELVVETLSLTLGVVDELDPPEDLRLATFNAVFGMFGKFYDPRAAALGGMIG